MARVYRACLVIIGNEILSGRTKDANLAFLGEGLNEIGIRLDEARVIPDVEERIVTTINEVRQAFDYVFTTGGIGPTHDDITSASVAKAFDLPLTLHPEAHRILLDYYGPERLTEARLRMAHTPEGAELVENDVSAAPGYQIGNVFVLAGVPSIMRSMFAKLRQGLTGGDPLISLTIESTVAEGQIARPLGEIQEAFPEVEIGSYPFFNNDGFGVRLVLRSTSEKLLSACAERVEALLAEVLASA